VGVEFTPSQQSVIDARDSSILVSAAAGSGKTAVLVERIIGRILDPVHPVDIDRILVLTFTNAAAGEMKERIRNAILERLAVEPDNTFLQKQATLVHNAHISTIHSFALFLLRNHFNEIGLDPAFRLADEYEMTLLQGEAMQELMEQCFEEKRERFLQCVENLAPDGKDSTLEDMIQNLSKYADSFPWPEKWLEERAEDYSYASVEELFTGEVGAYASHYLNGFVESWVKGYEKAVALTHEPDGPYMYGDTFEKEKEACEAVHRAEEFTRKLELLSAISFDRLSGKSDETVNALKREDAKKLRDALKKSISTVKEEFCAVLPGVAYSHSVALQEICRELIHLTLQYRQMVEEKKRAGKMVSMSDLEHLALQVVLRLEDGRPVPTAVALEYRDLFEEIMTDEYQDSNLVQEYLLSALSAEDSGRYNRFMVGDVKQSIYKFRLARPELFMQKYDTFGETGNHRKICLAKNFRSRPEVLDVVNCIFEKIMDKSKGGISYDEDAKLYFGATTYPAYDQDKAELLLVQKPDKEAEDDAPMAEAKAIAMRIIGLMQSHKVYDAKAGEMRPLKYSDIVILLRSTTDYADALKQVLEEQMIPAFVSKGEGYFETPEIKMLLSFLRVCDNPLQDIPFYGVLVSPIGGFTPEEVASIRAKHQGQSLYQSLTLEKQDEKVGSFLEKLATYRRAMHYLTVRELLEKLLEDTNYLNYITALPMGEKRKANVEVLLTKASEYGKTNFYGLSHFIRYLEKIQKYKQDFEEAEILDENADVVRIMTMHKSKGLEFPVTFVAGLGKQFNMMDSRGNLMIDQELGIGLYYFDTNRRLRFKTFRQKMIAKKIKEDCLAEEMRVLYVALTRAKEKLILCGTVKDVEESLQAIETQKENPFTYFEFMNSAGFLDYILPAIGNCPIDVKTVVADDLEAEQMTQASLRQVRHLNLAKQEIEHPDSEDVEKLYERFARTYSHENLQGLMAKTTVSELKIAAMADKDEAAFHAFEEEEVVPYLPRFMREEEEVTGVLRGNAYHRVMELFDFQMLLDEMVPKDASYEIYSGILQEKLSKEVIGAVLDQMAKTGYLQGEYRPIVQENKITAFLLSKMGYRMWKAQRNGTLYREQPFVLGVEASRLDPKYPEGEQVLIQGIIDAYFEENGKLVLLDYKTDSVSDMESLWNRYGTQLAYYKEALEKLTGLQVEESYLYSFRLERYE